MSLPSRERGLKCRGIAVQDAERCVAPLAGAWIEICMTITWKETAKVAPLAGAWIEIVLRSATSPIWMSRSPRGSVD